MSFIRWMAHWDYVMRWSLWLHHPLLTALITVTCFILAAVVLVWGNRNG
jgi:hypothetical protein